MSQKITVLERDDFGQIRVIQENGKFLFSAVDAARALGYSNPWDAIRRHCKTDGLVKREGVTTTTNQYGKTTVQANEMLFITEGNVYRLIAHSKLPSAERFETWVFDEVIPSIRKHGAYMTESVLEQVAEKPEIIYALARQLLLEKQGHEEARQKLAVAQPKADYFDQFVNAGDTTNIRNSGKELGIPQKRFITFMLAHNYLYREKKLSGQLMPTHSASIRGYFIVRDVYTRQGKMVQQAFLTCKGKEHFRKMLHRIMEETV